MKKRFLFFALPTALFAATVVVEWLRRPAHLGPGMLVVVAQTITILIFSLAAGALLLLAAWVFSLCLRRPLTHKLEWFFGPTLLAFLLLSGSFLWIEIGTAFEERALAPMSTAWEAANPKTEAEVRALFGEPAIVDSDHQRWIYYPSASHRIPYQVWFSPDGTVIRHGPRSF
jgi:hypothetical protein